MEVAVSNAACIRCRKRKIKCTGFPCLYCNKKGFNCEFENAKKRGPPQKKVKVIMDGISQTQGDVGFLFVQEKIVNLYQMKDIIQFYFRTVGCAIPMELRASLLEDPSKNQYLKCQSYIAYAHTFRFLGQHDLSDKYENAAKNLSPIMFETTLESAIALIMMTLFIGLRDPKAWLYSSHAYNITKILEQSCACIQANMVSYSLSCITDPSINSEEKRTNVLITCLPASQMGMGDNQWALVITTALRVFQSTFLKFDFSIINYLDSFNKIVHIDENKKADYIRLLNDLEEVLQRYDDTKMDFKKSVLAFDLHFAQLLLNWRLGDIVQATYFAKYLMDSLRNDACLISLRFGLGELFFIPFSMQQKLGLQELALEGFSIIREIVGICKKREEVDEFYNEISLQFNSKSLTFYDVSEQQLLQIEDLPNFVTEDFSICNNNVF